jgi:L-lysine exporter family protein LysE/ArgO
MVFLEGFKLSLGLIVAIGAQNAFVLRQGVLRQHVLPVVLFCAGSDALLIGIGVGGFARLSALAPWVGAVALWGGIAFLLWLGAMAFRRAWAGGEALAVARTAPAPLGKVLGMLTLITWGNPHVWLDTVVFLGGISAQFPGQGLAFGLGAATASLVFFCLLGFGARVLAPVFARPRAWQVLELAIGVAMWSIAFRLGLTALTAGA